MCACPCLSLFVCARVRACRSCPQLVLRPLINPQRWASGTFFLTWPCEWDGLWVGPGVGTALPQTSLFPCTD